MGNLDSRVFGPKAAQIVLIHTQRLPVIQARQNLCYITQTAACRMSIKRDFKIF